MNKEVFLSKEGYKQLEEKLENLKVVKRAEVAEKIKIARSFGDISENAEYDAAKEEQAMLEGEIIEIEQKLRTAKIIDKKSISKDIISVGSTVKLLDIEFDEEIEYKIVGSVEANTKQGSISNESPLGKALLGKKKNDTVNVNAPNGIVSYKVLSISV